MLHFEIALSVKEKSRKLYIKTPSNVFSGLDIRFDNELGTYIATPNQETMTVADLQAKLNALNASKTINGERTYFLLDECIGTDLSTYLFAEPLAEKRFGVGKEYLVIATDIDLYNKVIKRRKFQTAHHLNTTLANLEATIYGMDDDEMRSKVDLNPIFQRGHVWTREQQVAYIENFLRSPQTVNKTIYMNDLFIYGSVGKVTDENNKIIYTEKLPEKLVNSIPYFEAKQTYSLKNGKTLEYSEANFETLGKRFKIKNETLRKNRINKKDAIQVLSLIGDMNKASQTGFSKIECSNMETIIIGIG